MAKKAVQKPRKKAKTRKKMSVGQASRMVMATVTDEQGKVLKNAGAEIARLREELADEREARLSLGGVVGEQTEQLDCLLQENVQVKQEAARLQKENERLAALEATLREDLVVAREAQHITIEDRDDAQEGEERAENLADEAKGAVAELYLEKRRLEKQIARLEQELEDADSESKQQDKEIDQVRARVKELKQKLAAAQPA